MTRLFFASFLSLILLISCSEANEIKRKKESNVFSDAKLQEIHAKKDHRDSNWLITELEKNDPHYSIAILNALSSNKDTMTFARIRKWLDSNDLDPEVYSAGYHSLANINKAYYTDSLIADINSNWTEYRKAYLYKTIGSMGELSGFEYLLNKTIKPGVMEGLFTSMNNGNSDIALIEKAIKALENEDSKARFWAAHILLRQREYDLSPDIETIINTYANEDNTDTKLALIGSLKKTMGSKKTAFLKNIFKNNSEPRIIVNAIRALNETDFPDFYKSITRYLSSKNYQVAHTTYKYLNKYYNPIITKELQVISELKDNAFANPIIKIEVLSLLSKDPSLRDDVFSKMISQYNSSKDNYYKMAILRALAKDDMNIGFIKKVISENLNPLTTGVAHEQILSMLAGTSDYEYYIRLGLESDNVALICQSVDAAALDTNNSNTELWIKKMNAKIEQLILPRQTEALVTLKNSIATLKKTTPQPHHPKFNNEIDWQYISTLPNRPKIEVSTNKGTIVWELYLDKIPAAVSSIVRLVDSSYYSMKAFHRVVPNFVAQGGCPRGDGWGSLDYTLRSEYADGIEYKRGSIGLASAGEDTESCQFFMCHSSTPHLNNRYTIIGEVVSGLDVMDNIAIGDTIIDMHRVN